MSHNKNDDWRMLRNDLEILRRKQQGYYNRAHHMLDVRLKNIEDRLKSLLLSLDSEKTHTPMPLPFSPSPLPLQEQSKSLSESPTESPSRSPSSSSTLSSLKSPPRCKVSKAVQTSFNTVEPICNGKPKPKTIRKNGINCGTGDIADFDVDIINKQKNTRIKNKLTTRNRVLEKKNTQDENIDDERLLPKEEIYNRYRHIRPMGIPLQELFRKECSRRGSNFLEASQLRVRSIKERSRLRKLMEKKIQEEYHHNNYNRKREFSREGKLNQRSNLRNNNNFTMSDNQLNQRLNPRISKFTTDSRAVILDHANPICQVLKPSDYKVITRFTDSAMKRQTSKIYKRLPEVVEKKRQIEIEQAKANHRLMSQLYNQRLHKNTLHGRIHYPLTIRESQSFYPEDIPEDDWNPRAAINYRRSTSSNALITR